LNGTWINTDTSDIYIFNNPDIEFMLAEDVRKIAQSANSEAGKGGGLSYPKVLKEHMRQMKQRHTLLMNKTCLMAHGTILVTEK